MSTLLNPKRTIADLKELRGLTPEEHGAQSVASLTPVVEALDKVAKKPEAIPVQIHADAAGRFWRTLSGDPA